MKNFLLRFSKQNIQLLSGMMIILVSFGFFGTSAVGQITSVSPSSRCGEGTLTLHATATTGTITWYDVPFYGTAVGTGSSFTTPTLSVTQAYYVDALDGNGCSYNTGSVRTPVIATVSASTIQSNIFYSSNTFCNSVNTAQYVTRTGTAGGTYSYVVTSGGPTLSLNTSTGAITPNTSSNGTYTVTYTVTAAEGCIENPASTTVTITTAPVQPAISYSGSPFCTSHDAVAVTQTGQTGGVYSASPSGLNIDPSTGTITPAGSTSESYEVTYFIIGAGGCAPMTATTTVVILQLPTAILTYASPFNRSQGSQSVTLAGTGVYTGGTYSSTTGLSIVGSTGAITPSASTAGTYTVTYTLAAVSPCASVTATRDIIITTVPTASITGTTGICVGGSANLTITLTGTGPWSFTYNDGPTPVSVTGQASSPYTFDVSPFLTRSYSLVSVNDANCEGTISGSSATVTVQPAPDATIEYSGSPYCTAGSDPSPNFPGVGTAGTFSAGTGLVFVDPSTGVIDVSASTAGDFTVTNTIAATGGCLAVTATTSVTITKMPITNFSYPNAAYCKNNTNPLPTMGTDAQKGIFSSSDGLLFVSVTTGEINLATSTAGTYVVSNTIAAASGCNGTTATTMITVNTVPAAYAGYNHAICPGTGTEIGGAAVTGNTYFWTSNPTTTFATTTANPTVSIGGTTSYTLTETTTATGCTNTHSIQISYADAPAANAITGTSTLCAGSVQTYAATANHGSDGGTYEWAYSVGEAAVFGSYDNVSTTLTYSTTATSGDLQMTETVMGCSTTNHLAITVNPLSTAGISGTTTVCANAPQPVVTFTGANGTANYTFTYNINGTGAYTVVSSGNTATVTAPTGTPGTYTYTLVSIRDASSTTCLNGATGTVVITVNPNPVATTSTDGPKCAGTTLSLTGGPASMTSYAWSGPNGFTSALQSPTISNVTTAADGTYSLTVTDGNTCSNVQTTSAVVRPLPTATIGGTVTVCQSSDAPTITFTGANATTLPYTFSYYINEGGTVTAVTSLGNSATTITAPTATSGTYTYNLVSVQESSSTACSNASSGNTVITVTALPAAPATFTAVNSAAGTVTLTAVTAPEGQTWYWQDTASGTDQTYSGTSRVITGVSIASHTYYLRSKDSSGCWSSGAGSQTVSVTY